MGIDDPDEIAAFFPKCLPEPGRKSRPEPRQAKSAGRQPRNHCRNESIEVTIRKRHQYSLASRTEPGFFAAQWFRIWVAMSTQSSWAENGKSAVSVIIESTHFISFG